MVGSNNEGNCGEGRDHGGEVRPWPEERPSSSTIYYVGVKGCTTAQGIDTSKASRDLRVLSVRL